MEGFAEFYIRGVDGGDYDCAVLGGEGWVCGDLGWGVEVEGDAVDD